MLRAWLTVLMLRHAASVVRRATVAADAALSAGNVSGGVAPPVADPTERLVIAILTRGSGKNIENLPVILRSLDQNLLRGHNETPDVLIFNEGDVSDADKARVTEGISLPVQWPVVEAGWSKFPEGFDVNGSGYLHLGWKGGSQYGYQRMIRFWFRDIFFHPAIAPYSQIMRLDADSCLVLGAPLASLMIKPGEVYKANVGTVDPEEFVEGLWNQTNVYVAARRRAIQNTGLWEAAKELAEPAEPAEPEEPREGPDGDPSPFPFDDEVMNGTFPFDDEEMDDMRGRRRRPIPSLPGWSNNWEVTRASFFRQADVLDFADFICDQPPYGIFSRRWGDAILRYLTLTIFATPAQLGGGLDNTRYIHWCGSRCCTCNLQNPPEMLPDGRRRVRCPSGD